MKLGDMFYGLGPWERNYEDKFVQQGDKDKPLMIGKNRRFKRKEKNEELRPYTAPSGRGFPEQQN